MNEKNQDEYYPLTYYNNNNNNNNNKNKMIKQIIDYAYKK